MIRQFVGSDFCLKCFGCCRFKEKDSVWTPKLLDAEAEKLGELIKLIANPEQDNFVCLSLDIPGNKCKIYHQRPFDCQLYPFLLNQRGENIFLAVDLNCPYVRQNLESQSFKEYVKELDDFLNSGDRLKQLRANLQLIQTYKEAQDLIELDI